MVERIVMDLLMLVHTFTLAFRQHNLAPKANKERKCLNSKQSSIDSIAPFIVYLFYAHLSSTFSATVWASSMSISPTRSVILFSE